MQVSFEDYVSMRAAASVMGPDAMLAHYRVAPPVWAQTSAYWDAVIPTRPDLGQFGALVEQEAARLRAGGPPRAIAAHAMGGSVPPPGAGLGGSVPPPGAALGGPNAFSGTGPPPPMQPQGQGWGAQPPQQGAWGQQPPQQGAWGAPPPQQGAWGAPPPQQNNFDREAARLGNQIGNAFSAFGSAVESFVDGAGGYTVGSRVMVQWADGNRYAATVSGAQGSQVEITFPDGRRMWMPSQYVTPA